MGKGASQFLATDLLLSLAPGFSRVIGAANRANRFSGFVAGKPLKRFDFASSEHTQLKLGANERPDFALQETEMRPASALSQVPACFFWERELETSHPL